jgi:hypothetical protein
VRGNNDNHVRWYNIITLQFRLVYVLAVCKPRQNQPFSKSRCVNCGKKKINITQSPTKPTRYIMQAVTIYFIHYTSIIFKSEPMCTHVRIINNYIILRVLRAPVFCYHLFLIHI